MTALRQSSFDAGLGDKSCLVMRIAMRLSPWLGLAILAHSCPAQTTWDLKSEWSNAANPNGVWSYNANGAPLTTFNPSFTGDSFTPAQPGWQGGGLIPIWFKSNSTSLNVNGVGTPDWLFGDVVLHSGSGGGYTDVTWTSPINGTINISGAVWAVRDISRSNNWSLYHGANLLTGGTIGSGDPYNRGSPFSFTLGSGGAGAVSNLAVVVGSVIQLRVGTAGTGDYAGVNLTITAIPEPAAAVAALGLSCLAFALGWRRRL